MQRIFQERKFELTKNKIGVDTITLTAQGFKFFYYNPRFQSTVEEIHQHISHDERQASGVEELTVADGNYTLENWPFVILSVDQYQSIVEASMAIKTARSALHDAETAARLVLDQLR